VDFVKLKFIGGYGKPGLLRGPWLSYTTGEVYVLPERYADKKSYPHFEFMGEATQDEIPEPWRTRLGLDKEKNEIIADEYGLTLEQVKRLKDVLGVKPQPSQKKVEPKKEPEEEEPEEDEDIDIETHVEPVDTSSVGGMLTEKEIFNGMDVNTLKLYIINQDGKVDNRWGHKRLVQEALKLQ